LGEKKCVLDDRIANAKDCRFEHLERKLPPPAKRGVYFGIEENIDPWLQAQHADVLGGGRTETKRSTPATGRCRNVFSLLQKGEMNTGCAVEIHPYRQALFERRRKGGKHRAH